MTNSLGMYSNLQRWLVQHLPPLRRRVRETLGWMILGVQKARHVHLSKMASHRPGAATLCSRIRQLRRWLENPAVEVRTLYAALTERLLARAAQQQGRLRLLIDVLELSGRRQILLVALAYRRRAIPLLWQVSRGKGVSDAQRQIALLEALAPQLPDGAEVVLLGDGEFHSVALMQYLAGQGWHFCLKVHADTRVQLQEGRRWQRLDELALQPGQRRVFPGVRLTESQAYGPLTLVLHWRKGEEEPWRLVSSWSSAYRVVQSYGRRMWIEELFGDLQGGGFRLEQSRLWEPERLSRLLLVVVLAYCWLLHVGAHVIKRGWRRLVDRNDRRDRSLAEIGRHWIRRCLTNGKPPRVGFIPYFA